MHAVQPPFAAAETLEEDAGGSRRARLSCVPPHQIDEEEEIDDPLEHQRKVCSRRRVKVQETFSAQAKVQVGRRRISGSRARALKLNLARALSQCDIRSRVRLAI